MQRKRLLQKLQMYQVNESIILWIKFLICYRNQRVKLNGYFSDMGRSNEWNTTGYNFASHLFHNLEKLLTKSL